MADRHEVAQVSVDRDASTQLCRRRPDGPLGDVERIGPPAADRCEPPSVARPLDRVGPCRPGAEHGGVDRRGRAVGGPVVREVGVQPPIVHELLGADLVEQHLATRCARRRPSFGGDTRWGHVQHPGRAVVAMCRRDVDAVAEWLGVRQEDEPRAGRRHGLQRQDVVRCGGQGGAGRGGDLHQGAAVHTVLAVGDGAVDGVELALGARHPIAWLDGLDASGARRGGDERAPWQALVAVADGGELAAVLGQQHGEFVLGLVRVLVLVDQDVLEPLLVAAQHIGVLAEQLDGLGEQVVEVHRAGPEQAMLVLAVHLGVLAVEDVGCRCLGGVGADELVLPLADRAVHRAWGEPLGIETEVADDVAGEPLGVGLVVDAERARVAEPVGVGAQDAHAGGMERADPHLVRHRTHQHGDALAHLAGRLVGERDRQDLHGMHALVDEVGDAVGEHPGLARTGAGHHQERAAAMHDGIELVGVQPLEVGASATVVGGGWLGGHGSSILRNRCDGRVRRTAVCRKGRGRRGARA